MTATSTIALSDSYEMPKLGLGTSKVAEGDEMNNVVAGALAAGYRLIDTASIYGNERGVGEAIRHSDLGRDAIFVTTKLWNTDQGYEPTLVAFQESMDRLGMDYIDLFLIHWPDPARTADTWRAMEHLQRQGVVRSIGVSNFEANDLDQLMISAETPPTVNQIELHPLLQQRQLRQATADIGAVTQAWSPLRRGTILNNPVIASVARDVDRTPAQVVLRSQVQEGIAVIPKSTNQVRVRENSAIFDFVLSKEQLESLHSLDVGDRL